MCMPLYKKLCLQLFVVLNCLTISLSAQNFLEIPVKLEVEKDDLSEVVVKVKKDGKDAFTQSGASKMRFKLDFNKKYTLIFTKPGYITKTIEVNTSAPASRISNGFEPYKIGVKLFLQNDENMVVYNQPVAQIKYDANIDEFNFDTDYSKSILSAISRDDSEEKKPVQPSAAPTVQPVGGADVAPEPVTTAKAPAPEPPQPVSAQPVVAEETIKPSATVAQATEPPPVATPPSEAKNDPPPPAPVKAEETPAPVPPPPVAIAEKPAAESVKKSDEGKKAAAPVAGQDERRTAAARSGEDSRRVSNARAGEDKPAIKAIQKEGNEVPPVFNRPVSANEAPPGDPQFREADRVTREDIVEKNRVITRIKVIKNGIMTEYSRVNYSWGGEFYFRNSTQSISPNLFVHWTCFVK